MSEKPDVLSCVLVPVAHGDLLLPNVSIAEIIDYSVPEVVDNAPDWLAGKLSWRGLSLPVISYDGANGLDPQPDDGRSRIVVLNTIGEQHQKLPFLALITRGIPRQAKVDESMLAAGEGSTGPADLMIVDFEGETTRIPNLEYLEQLASDYAPA